METRIMALLGTGLLINLCSFFLMLDDKQRARENDTRVSEGKLLFASIAFGALGVWAGMYVARHKTKKLIFVVGVPLALVEQLALLWFLVSQFAG